MNGKRESSLLRITQFNFEERPNLIFRLLFESIFNQTLEGGVQEYLEGGGLAVPGSIRRS